MNAHPSNQPNTAAPVSVIGLGPMGQAMALHATALVGSAGMSAEDFIPEVLATLANIPVMIKGEQIGRQIDTGNYPGELSTVTMMGAPADHILATSETAGVELTLPKAVKTHYDRAIADGHGSDNWTSIIEGIKPGERSWSAR